MGLQTEDMGGGRPASQPAAGASGPAHASTAIGVLALLLAAAAFGTSFVGVRGSKELLALAGLASATYLVARRKVSPAVARAQASPSHVLDSAGAAVLAISTGGRVTYANPAAERLLGYHGAELRRDWSKLQILAPGEGARLVEELQRLCGIEGPVAETSGERMAAYLECVQMLPPSMVPGFEARVRSRDGALLPVTLHISAMRSPAGVFEGLVVVALEQSGARLQQDAQPESQDRRDLIENAQEMIATLSCAGRFLYANAA
ncbi:MAG: PAS domain-containing protein, partial [Acidobacteriota bacterium]